jgi:hypothetical protein
MGLEGNRLEISIRAAATEGGDVSVAELGVLLTALNRALNAAYDPLSITRGPRATLAREPTALRLEILEVKQGSVILTVAVNVLHAATAAATAHPVIAGILGKLAGGLLSDQLKAAAKRVWSGGRQDDRDITVTVASDSNSVSTNVSVRHGKVSVHVNTGTKASKAVTKKPRKPRG